MQVPPMPAPPPRTWTDLLRWTYIGVDPKFPGNGGPECADYTGDSQRILETIVFATMGSLEAYFAFWHLTLPRKVRPQADVDWLLGRILLLVLCLTFGTEVGFKLSSGQLIYTLNPCHLVTMIQIYLLAAPTNRFTLALFRFHMHMLAGPLLALIFPVVNTRVLPCETSSYFIQHVLIYVIPYFLMRRGGVYLVEPMRDFSWTIFSCGILYVYHFIPLHAFSLLTQVNLNNMLCPALSDPFSGPYYRWYAAGHQTLLICIHGKLYMLFAGSFLPEGNENKRRCFGRVDSVDDQSGVADDSEEVHLIVRSELEANTQPPIVRNGVHHKQANGRTKGL